MKRVNFNTDFCHIYVGRPSKYGNPFVIGIDGSRNEVLERFEQYVYARPALIQDIRRELAGKILGCHCLPSIPCHADFLIRIANGFQLAFILEDI